MSVLGGEWTCHVCGESRPDAVIGVYTKHGQIPNVPGSTMSVNVRYCLDNADCMAGSYEVAERWLAIGQEPDG